jgi:hypothetical protein
MSVVGSSWSACEMGDISMSSTRSGSSAPAATTPIRAMRGLDRMVKAGLDRTESTFPANRPDRPETSIAIPTSLSAWEYTSTSTSAIFSSGREAALFATSGGAEYVGCSFDTDSLSFSVFFSSMVGELRFFGRYPSTCSHGYVCLSRRRMIRTRGFDAGGTKSRELTAGLGGVSPLDDLDRGHSIFGPGLP